MLDHIGFPVSDLARSRAFYEQVLAPLGYRAVIEVTKAESGGAYEGVGFGAEANLISGSEPGPH